MVSVENVSKIFPAPFSFSGLFCPRSRDRCAAHALNGISFDVAGGESLAILGPNGAGKTTLLKIIATLVLPDSGSVTVAGLAAGSADRKIRSLIGFVSGDERSFYWRLTGRQNLEFFAALYGLSKQATRSRIEYLLDIFCVDYGDRRFDSYSSGMRRRFALMRALLHEPALMLLDEPTQNLDHASADMVRCLIRDRLALGNNTTVIFTTHNLQEAADSAQRFLILDKGRIAGTGTLDALRRQAGEPGADLDRIYLKLTETHVP
ncbi:MAG: ABC transporter ATP-binding protein [Candidatus Omnitrophica bacterium]|nr:ABC transporter ATP-binding protein [Candidatus Omnitrophota bacterium]